MTQNELRVSIRGEMDVTRAMLDAGRFSKDCGFEEASSMMISTAVSELARNIIRHGGGRGEIRLAQVRGQTGAGIRVEARDTGPGITDVELALEDHFSSAGTLGLGLPGVKRLMDDFEIDSTPGEGTQVRAYKWLHS